LVELGAREARLASEVRPVTVLLGVLDTGPLAALVASACASVAAMNAISASRTAYCMGSLVAPSNVKLLITVRITTPRRMKCRMVSHTSS
jgi:hypothetical protein